jgi:DNA-binding response OmpR family regulator
VLLIEDDNDTRVMTRVLFELEGHVVEEAGDGQTGIQIALEQTFDVVFVDICLPHKNGYEVARAIRSQSRPAPCLVALTGQGIDPAEILAAGFDAFLMKPVDDRDLWRLLEKLPRRAQRQSPAGEARLQNAGEPLLENQGAVIAGLNANAYDGCI